MRKSIFLLATLTLLLSVQTRPCQGEDKDEEYKVYSALLKATHQADKPKTLVIIRTTSRNELVLPGSDDQKDILNSLSPLIEETLKNYNSQNSAEMELANKFGFTAKVALVDEKEINEIFRQPGLQDSWKTFYQKYPDSGGFIKLSRVGFDVNASQALVYVSHYCGGLCASGTYYLLTKEKGEWKVKKENLIWVS
jgi:hypothetical protein